jgi:hypothetical protein
VSDLTRSIDLITLGREVASESLERACDTIDGVYLELSRATDDPTLTPTQFRARVIGVMDMLQEHRGKMFGGLSVRVHWAKRE